MEIKINVEEIEFEIGAGRIRGGRQIRTIDFNFHDRLRIKKAFESELTRLLSDSGDGNFSIGSVSKLDSYTLKNRKINFIKDMEGEGIELSTGNKNASKVGKSLAKSIYSSLI